MNKLIFDSMRKGEEVYALIVSRTRFPNVGSAKLWAQKHAMKTAEIYEYEFEYHLRPRVFPPSRGRRILRGVNLLPGIRVLYVRAADTS